MFFNERFEFVQEGSTALRVSQPGDNAAPLVLSNIKAPKNGYVYIYLSNETDDAVYFDNFAVSYTRGRIIEENHYYAFGLRIAGISSRKFDGGTEGNLINHYLYNDKEFFEDAGLDWYDYGFRNYDPQIGRFTQLDPLTWDYPELTNYQYASNEPIANVDLDGLEALPSIIHFGQWFNLPQMLAPVVISAKLPAAAVKAGVSFGAKAVSTASSLLSIANVGLQQVGRGIDNTYVRSSPQTVERVGDNTLQSAGNRQVVIPGQQVMGPISWYEKLSGQRSVVTDDGFGNSVRLGVDDEGYATSSIVAESFEFPFIPERTPLSIVKFLKGAGKGASHLKSILPSWKKVSIDIEHIASGHMKGGLRTSGLKDLFPESMNVNDVSKAVRNAYRNVHSKLRTQGERLLLRGTTSNGLEIEMWLNKSTKMIETAYPVY